jgi:hypothetical protein
MHWCKMMDRKAYVALMRIYTSSLGKLYERDIKQFMEEAKQRILASKIALTCIAVVSFIAVYILVSKRLYCRQVKHDY